jgi:predicted TIM-barrel fold metal-dependent hydrolase
VEKENCVRAFVDVDVHETLHGGLRSLEPFLPPEWKRYTTDMGYTGIRTTYLARDPSPALRTPEDNVGAGPTYADMRERLLDRSEVRAAVLNGSYYSGGETTQLEFQSALASAYNDWVAATWLSRDERLLGSIHVSADPDAAADEIDRLASHPQIVQVMLPISPTEWAAPRFWPIFEATERHGLVLAMEASVDARCAVPLPDQFAAWYAGYTQNYQAQLIGLILSGIFDRFPALRVLMTGGGWTWLPHVMWRLDRTWRALRVPAPIDRRPSEYAQDNIRLAFHALEIPEKATHLLRMIDMVGTDRFLVFGTNYPIWHGTDPIKSISTELKDFPSDLVRRITVENALELYGSRLVGRLSSRLGVGD